MDGMVYLDGNGCLYGRIARRYDVLRTDGYIDRWKVGWLNGSKVERLVCKVDVCMEGRMY